MVILFNIKFFPFLIVFVTLYDNFPVLDKEERNYRQWCAQNSLFLNPLNDILTNNVVWRDIMHLLNMIMNVKDEQKMRFLV